MEPVPPYLVLYLWKIRKGSGKPGYLKSRLQDKGLERAVYEKSMLWEMRELHLVALSNKHDHLVFDGGVGEDRPPAGEPALVTENKMAIPRTVTVLARGHWLWTEWVASSGKWLLTAVLGALIALAIAG